MTSSGFQQYWYKRSHLLHKRAPENIALWLFDNSSLTARLVRNCENFKVNLISQKLEKASLDECKALGLNHGESALIRQVYLQCDGAPVVYARTVIPLSTLTGSQRRYSNLGSRPLGAMLFADRNMRRDEIMVTCLHPDQSLYAKIAKVGDDIWGRRSVFRVGGKPLLVSEFYLPGLFNRS